MSNSLHGKAIAILATDGVEQNQLSGPRSALDEAGAETRFIAPKTGLVRGWNHDQYGNNFVADAELKNTRVEDYDALLLPGGVLSTDKLRMTPMAVDLVRAFFDAGKPIAAICHGQHLLIEADVVNARKVTSVPSLRTDLTNAGAEWLDQAVVADHGLITSRRAEDLPAFIAKMIEEFAAPPEPKSTSENQTDQHATTINH
jgi:protease I